MEPPIDEPRLVEPHFVIREIPNTHQQALELPKSEGITNLRAAVNSGELLTFARGAPEIFGRIIHRSDFNDLVLEHSGGLELLSSLFEIASNSC